VFHAKTNNSIDIRLLQKMFTII